MGGKNELGMFGKERRLVRLEKKEGAGEIAEVQHRRPAEASLRAS